MVSRCSLFHDLIPRFEGHLQSFTCFSNLPTFLHELSLFWLVSKPFIMVSRWRQPNDYSTFGSWVSSNFVCIMQRAERPASLILAHNLSDTFQKQPRRCISLFLEITRNLGSRSPLLAFNSVPAHSQVSFCNRFSPRKPSALPQRTFPAKMSAMSDTDDGEYPTPSASHPIPGAKNIFEVADPITPEGQQAGAILRIKWISETMSKSVEDHPHPSVGDHVKVLSFSISGLVDA